MFSALDVSTPKKLKYEISMLKKRWDIQKRLKEGLDEKAKNNTLEDSQLTYEDVMSYIVALGADALQLEQYDIAVEIGAAMQEIDPGTLDGYYVVIIANICKARDSLKNPKIQLDELACHQNPVIRSLIIASESLKMAMARVLQTGDVREYESGLVERLSSLMREVGGPPLVV